MFNLSAYLHRCSVGFLHEPRFIFQKSHMSRSWVLVAPLYKLWKNIKNVTCTQKNTVTMRCLACVPSSSGFLTAEDQLNCDKPAVWGQQRSRIKTPTLPKHLTWLSLWSSWSSPSSSLLHIFRCSLFISACKPYILRFLLLTSHLTPSSTCSTWKLALQHTCFFNANVLHRSVSNSVPFIHRRLFVSTRHVLTVTFQWEPGSDVSKSH